MLRSRAKHRRLCRSEIFESLLLSNGRDFLRAQRADRNPDRTGIYCQNRATAA